MDLRKPGRGESTSEAIDVEGFLDSRRIGPRHLVILALLIAAMAIDGYDIFMVAFILPDLAHGLGVQPQALTGLFVIQQFGLLIGTLLVGPLADRFGRRRVLLTAMAAFALCTLATSQVRTVLELEAMRFVAGLFFSAVIPTSIALVSEFAPRRLRAGAVALVFSGYSAGNLVGAGVQAWILPFGWRAAFWVGGLLPVALLVLAMIWLPESVQFRTLRNPKDPSIRRSLAALDPRGAPPAHATLFIHQGPARTGRFSLSHVFAEGRFLSTLLIWIAFFSACVFTYISGSWGVTLMHVTRGVPMAHIALLTAAGGVTGILGCASSGFMVDRFGASRVLPIFLAGAAISISAIALMDLESSAALIAFAALGFFSNSGWGGLNALSSGLYPPRLRATGVAWAVGAGKAGAMVGPVIGGALIARHWDLTPIYLLAAVPEALAAAAVVALVALRRPAAVPNTAPAVVT